LALFPKSSSNQPDRKEERRAAQEQVFLREVDDALREDEAARLLRRHGTMVGGAILAVLVAMAGWLVWSNHQATLAGQKGEAFTIALDQLQAGRWDTARASLDQIAATGATGPAASAKLVAAGAAQERKQADQAVRGFAAVAADSAAPQPYRDLATVREVAAKFDTMPPQQVVDTLKPLAVPGTPWFGSAGEMIGVAQIKLGHKAEAGAMFAALAKDSGVPASLRGRARQVAVQLGADPGPDLSAAAGGFAQ